MPTKETFITFATSSDQASGRISAQWLSETLDFEGKVVMLGGLAGASPANGESIMSALIQKYGDDIAGVWADSGRKGSAQSNVF